MAYAIPITAGVQPTSTPEESLRLLVKLLANKDPLPERVRWYIFNMRNKKLKARERIIAYDRSGRGFLVAAFIATDNPDIMVIFNLHSTTMFTFTFTPREVYKYGLIGHGVFHPIVTKWAPSEKVFAVLFTGTFPGIPFTERNVAWIYNPTNKDAIIYRADATVILERE